MQFLSRLLCYLGLSALSMVAIPALACTWTSGGTTAKALTYNAGAVFSPRDVPIGTTLNNPSPIRAVNFGDRLRCGSSSIYNVALIGPLAADIPVDYLNVPANALLQTNVPGVGLAVYITGFAAGWRGPADNPNRFVPLNLTYASGTIAEMPSVMFRYMLVKTGDIPAGTHSINQLVASGTTNIGPMFDLTFTATITVAGCSMPAAPGNQIDVPMGTWEKRVFNGKDSTTPATPFAITLSACIAGSNYPNNANGYFNGNYANIQIDGNKTSSIVDAANGILSLSSDSTAQGVAIQVLQANDAPMNLGQPVRLNRIVNGTTTVPLKARYIQIGDGPTPMPGTADGHASFTVTYR
ncbi:fimbrial protein [Pseudomonas sp. P7548]|uniref:fimbrial protein n=1 Tax=Pseudomonas sp. P7548 TaxID=2726981 RepID=UPI000EBF8422|nr:fimbrial protein [Pseudomonas sp. P7548]NWE23668.1 type 1 fimbrial protein [Pseudomonas sp. P7548]HCT04577.1 pilus assembly protein FimA [Pseudomonas sp.]